MGGMFSSKVADILGKVKNRHYNYLISVESDTYGNFVPDNKYIFEYTAENDKCITNDNSKIMCTEVNKTKQILSNFFGSGTYSAVFSINKIKKNSNEMETYDNQKANFKKPFKKRRFNNVVDCIPDENVIIKMFRPENLNTFINTWKDDKNMYGDHIIDIYLYGSIIDENGKEISKYIITKKYKIITDNTINQLNLTNRLKLIISMLDFCNRLQSEGKVWSDLKSENIGYMIKDDIITTVVIDYDEMAIIDKTKFSILYKKLKHLSYLIISKTYIPAYADIFINNPYIWTDNNFELLSTFIIKLSIIGVVDIINVLLLEGFYGTNGVNLSTLIFYFNFDRLRDKKNNSNTIINFAIPELYVNLLISHLRGSIIVFGEEYNKIKQQILKIMVKILGYEYAKIPLCDEISEEFRNLLDETQNLNIITTLTNRTSSADYTSAENIGSLSTQSNSGIN